jgi:hypothetical protein
MQNIDIILGYNYSPNATPSGQDFMVCILTFASSLVKWIVALDIELVILTTRRNKEQRHFDQLNEE